jgi:hypothetical protein
MGSHMRFVFTSCLIVCSLLFIGFNASGAPPDPPYRVFILHSYESDNVCGQPQQDGVVSALGKAGLKDQQDLMIETYFMDTKRRNNTEELIHEQAQIAIERIRSFRPDILVVLDDNAFRTVALCLADTSIPIVFCGMNGQPEAYHKQEKDRGTTLRASMKSSILWMPSGYIPGSFQEQKRS